MEYVISSDEEAAVQLVLGASKKRSSKVENSSSDSEKAVKKANLKTFRKRISKTSKSQGQSDFFDFNSEFVKIKPKISTEKERLSQENTSSCSDLKENNASVKEITNTSCTIEENCHVQDVEEGTITPPPLVFKQEKEELNKVFKRIKSLEGNAFKSSLENPRKAPETRLEKDILVKIRFQNEIILQESVNLKKNFQNLYSKSKVLKGDVLLFYQNNRIYPSATPESIFKLFKVTQEPSDLELEIKKKEMTENPILFNLLTSQDCTDDVYDFSQDTQVSSDTGINIKIQDKDGLQLKLSCKETTKIQQITHKWSQEFQKDPKSFKLKSQGDVLNQNDSLGDADVEDGDVLEIFYL